MGTSLSTMFASEESLVRQAKESFKQKHKDKGSQLAPIMAKQDDNMYAQVSEMSIPLWLA